MRYPWRFYASLRLHYGTHSQSSRQCRPYHRYGPSSRHWVVMARTIARIHQEVLGE